MDERLEETEIARRAKRIFERLMAVDPSRRDALLDRLSTESSEVVRRVKRLLARDETLGDFLEPPLGPAVWPRFRPLDRGEEIAGYTIVGLLGRGGMGEVYLAERAVQGFRQSVALKLLRPEVASGDLDARFRAEQGILARLEHPNIARLIDGGVTEGGVSFLAMEYVDGEPITESCDARQLGVSERLEILEKVCAAVDHAHRNLVVHRDLKPSNILVTKEGEPKLLDFGIAKLLDPAADATAPMVRRATRNYASPEHLAGRPITPASDVYSLGVILYQLLTGTLPFDWSDQEPAEVAERIMAEPPPVPSIRIAAGQHSERAARDRGTSPRLLERCLAGDLDAVVLTALRPDPNDRYTSAESLSEDVQRFRRGFPVRARRHGRLERSRKWVRRNRALAAALASIVVLLVAAGTGGYVQAMRIAQERDAAERERITAERITRFVVETFRSADPTGERGDIITVREALEAATPRIAADLSEEPEVQASLLHTFGLVWGGLGAYDEAEARFREALVARERLFGPDAPEVGATLHELGSALVEAGAPERGREALERALTIRRGDPGAVRDEAATLVELGEALLELGAYSEAERSYRSSLSLLEDSTRSEVGPVLADAISGLANVKEQEGDLDAAEGFYRRALEVRRRLHGEEHLQVGVALNNLGLLLRRKGVYLPAEEHLTEALRQLESSLGENHPYVATTLANVGLVRLDRGDYLGAEPMLRRALELRRVILGEEHPHVVLSLDSLAWAILLGKGDYSSVEPLVRESLALNRRLFGESHPSVATSLHNLSALHLDQGDVDEGENLARQSLEMRREFFAGDHPLIAMNEQSLAWVAMERGDFETARERLEAVIETYREALGANHPLTAGAVGDLGFLQFRAGELEAAADLYREALQIQVETLGADHPASANTRVRLGRLLVDAHRPDEAERQIDEALRVYGRSLGEGHWRLADAHSVRAVVLATRGRELEALRLLRVAGDSVRDSRGDRVFEARWIAARLMAIEAGERP